MAGDSRLTGIELNGVMYSLGKSIYDELGVTLERFAELLGRDLYCPTLSAKPTSSTLQYTDTDNDQHTFQVGQPCRWKEGNDYRLAVCTDITASSSSWYVLPIKVSELTNDAGYLTQHQDISGKLDATTAASTYATKTEVNKKQDKVLKFTNLAASQWVSDSTYEGYPYRCDVTCSGVTADNYAEVVFALSQATSGNYAPLCETKANAVSIWSSENTSITIPTILVTI